MQHARVGDIITLCHVPRDIGYLLRHLCFYADIVPTCCLTDSFYPECTCVFAVFVWVCVFLGGFYTTLPLAQFFTYSRVSGDDWWFTAVTHLKCFNCFGRGKQNKKFPDKQQSQLLAKQFRKIRSLFNATGALHIRWASYIRSPRRVTPVKNVLHNYELSPKINASSAGFWLWIYPICLCVG